MMFRVVRLSLKKGWRAPKLKREVMYTSGVKAEAQIALDLMADAKNYHYDGEFTYFIEEEVW